MFSKPQFTEKEIANLHQAYLDAIYEVYDGEKTIKLSIGQNNPKLDLVLTKYGDITWALITAYNPYSQCLSATENQQRHQSLIEFMRSHHLTVLDAVGKDRDGVWIPEKSLLIVDIALEQAILIGKRFQQNAIIFGELNQESQLIWL